MNEKQASFAQEHIVFPGYDASPGGPLCICNAYNYNPTLGLFFGTCLHTTSDDDQTRPQHTQTHKKHHYHGGYGASLGGPLCNTSKMYVPQQVRLTSHESETAQKAQTT
jgi:hypothetical protein